MLPVITAPTRRAAAALLGCILLTSCTGDGGNGGGGGKDGGASPKSGELRIIAGVSEIDLPYALGDRIYGLPESGDAERLLGAVNSPFVANLAPAAVPNRDGSLVAYHTFKHRRPVLLVHDFNTHEDSSLARGAFSLAWGRHNRIAYFKGLDPRVRNPQRYLGHVFVQRSLRSSPKRWTTTPDRYAVSAWAGKRLIVHRMGRAWPDLLVLDRPRHARVLHKRAALIALSPDGLRAFITAEPSPSPIVRVVNIANGKVLASLDVADVPKEVVGEPITYVADSGSWSEDEVVAAVSGGLAVFRVDAARITLEQTMRVSADAFPTGLLEPRAGESGRYIATWGELAPRPRAAVSSATILGCDRVTLRCERGRSIAAPLVPRTVYNPSRP
jgi:hypothetical protein